MPGRVVMPQGAGAVRKAVLSDLRITLVAIRSALRILRRAEVSPGIQPIINSIIGATARAERTIERLEKHLAVKERHE